MDPAADPADRRGRLGVSIIIGVSACSSGFGFGYNTGIIAPSLDLIAAEFGLGTFQKSVAATSILFGGMLGAIASGPLSRRVGSRPMLLAAGMIYALFACLVALASDFYTLTAARTVLGLALGISSMVTPLYVGETASVRWRGALVSMIQLFITLGILVSYVAGLGLAPGGHWRVMMGLGGVSGVALFGVMLLLPESPRWLLLAGREAQALAAFARLGEPQVDPAKLAGIRAAAAHEGGTWSELFSVRMRPVLVVAAGLFTLQNLCGIDAVLYYAPRIFELAGFHSQSTQLLSTAGVGAINVLATLVAVWLVDRLGRRKLLLAGLVPMIVSLALMAYLLLPSNTDHAIGAAVCLGVFVAGFAISLGPIPFIVMAEIFPLRVRSLGMSVASCSLWLFNMAVTLSFLSLIEGVGGAVTFWIFSGICLAAFGFAYWLVPETRGCSLEQIEADLEAGVPTRLLGRGQSG